jgi:anti-anti-sigma factor
MRSFSSSDLPVESTDAYTRVLFPAEVDLTNAPDISDQLLRLLNTGAHALILDLTGTRFFSSSGINVIIRAHLRASALGARLAAVVPAGGHVRRIFDLVDLPRLITTAGDLDAARTALAAPAAEPPGATTDSRSPG